MTTGQNDLTDEDRDRPDQRTPEQREPRSEELSNAERELLASRVARAAEAVFPRGERMGKTIQQDFYFRELVEVLIENVFQNGVLLVGGTYVELWQFTRDRVAKWRGHPDSKRGRSGYDRQSIKTLVHEWKRAFMRRRRAFGSNGEIEFFLDAPSVVRDDLVLRVAVSNSILSGERPLERPESELSPLSRLPSVRMPDSEDEEKRRLLREARKYVRRLETQYLTKLADAPLEFIQDEVRELQRARRDYRRLAIAIVVVVSTAMAAYKILYTKLNVGPVVGVEVGSEPYLKNFDVDDKKGRVAVTAQGKRVTEWANVIVGQDGASVRYAPEVCGPEQPLQFNGYKVIRYDFTYPKQWLEHEHPETILNPQVSCLPGQGRFGIACVILVDLRKLWPKEPTMQFSADYGDNIRSGGELVVFGVKGTRVSNVAPRFALTVFHEYDRPGTYWMTLHASPDTPYAKVPNAKAPGGHEELVPVCDTTSLALGQVTVDQKGAVKFVAAQAALRQRALH